MNGQILSGAILAALLTAPQALGADAGQTPPPNFVIPTGTQDVTKAIAGNYVLDQNHVAVLAHVSHLGFSMSLFRFGKAEAKLFWDPKEVGKSRLTATVDTASIATNVPNFAEELAGPGYLDAAKYPTATFVSTAFHQTDATHGTVDGTFTLRGKSVPVTFAVTLVGAGPGFAGSMEIGHVIGMHAETTINPQDFGFPAMFKTPVQITVDTEFDRKKADNP